MFDTMTMTKVVGAFCGSLLVFLLIQWGAETIYHAGGGHGEEHAQAYSIPTGEEEEAETEVVEETGPTFEEAFETASADSGERLYRQCQACHRLEDGANAVGPHLYGVVGRDVGSVADFGYSGALSEAADVWTPENLNAFLTDPRSYAPGTSMSYSGMDDIEDRANLIAYLQSNPG